MPGKKVLVYSAKYIDRYEELLRKHVPGAEYLFFDDPAEAAKHASEAEIALVTRSFPPEHFPRMERLEWIQVMAAGIENYMARKELFRDIPVCRIVGAFGKYMAEYVFGYLFYLSQGIGRVVKAQAQKQWDPFLMEFVHRKTLGIMGLGTIGLFIAEKAKAFGMRVVSWDMARRETPFVDRQYEASEMKAFLGEADFVLLTVPATPRTVDLVNRDVFRAMKKTAYLINICRGTVVDEAALVEALRAGEIAGAVIDVMKEEPLPPESPLWDCPNLIVSAHISGPSLPEDMVEVFKENYRRFLAKEPLLGRVDFDRGF
jgi:phosphoglycerate dehydrogenase-like enzyme